MAVVAVVVVMVVVVVVVVWEHAHKGGIKQRLHTQQSAHTLRHPSLPPLIQSHAIPLSLLYLCTHCMTRGCPQNTARRPSTRTDAGVVSEV